ncbi:MAG: DUF1572 family protein [Saprospiraceae bacterium]|nr:DUF1572 family protein [Saprospiraceae bacterium]
MTTDILKIFFNRDLNLLKNEIESYQHEKNIWHVEPRISNSAGNLSLHLIGNLNAYIGVGLAKTNYIRQRDLEFLLKDIPKKELISRVEETKIMVELCLSNITEMEMESDFPIVIFDKPTGMLFTLVHLLSHLNYHLGQINYHRRLLDK